MSATKNRSISLAGPVLCLIMLAIVLIACGTFWMSPDHAKAYLDSHGYTKIEMTGHRDMLCGHNGPGAVGFSAEKDGKKVNGAVCENFGGGIVVVEE